jgi:hypothetical protein
VVDALQRVLPPEAAVNGIKQLVAPPLHACSSSSSSSSNSTRSALHMHQVFP